MFAREDLTATHIREHIRVAQAAKTEEEHIGEQVGRSTCEDKEDALYFVRLVYSVGALGKRGGHKLAKSLGGSRPRWAGAVRIVRPKIVIIPYIHDGH